jgi:GNAT superfamily N-acetyltransferase
MDTQRQIQAYLNTDRLKYLVHLKFLHLYHACIAQHYIQVDDGAAVLLSYRTQDIFWDAKLYPFADFVLMPTATTPAAAAALLTYVRQDFPPQPPLVIKFCDEITKAAFAANYALQFADAYISYTARTDAVFPLPPQVVVANHLSEDCAALYLLNGFNRNELAKYFTNGATCFTIYEADQVVCTCLVYQNFDNIWEIGGVHTVELARRRGYAKLVVQAALHTLLAQGRIPRYLVSAMNTPSIQLAECLGMQPCLRFEHYTHHLS